MSCGSLVHEPVLFIYKFCTCVEVGTCVEDCECVGVVHVSKRVYVFKMYMCQMYMCFVVHVSVLYNVHV